MRELLSKGFRAAVAATALTAVVLSLIAIVKLNELSRIESSALQTAATDDTDRLKQVVAQARGDQSVTLTGNDEREYALSGAEWTQQASETDQLVGRVVYNSECPDRSPFQLRFFVDGASVGFTDASFFRHRIKERQTVDFQVYRGPAATTLFAPGGEKRRRLTVRIRNTCDARTTVRAVKVNVLGFR